MENNMKILVTGNKGMIGSRLEKALMMSEFSTVHRNYSYSSEIFGIDIKDGLNLLTCDLPEVDLIYHLAAQSSVESSWKDPVYDMDNIRMTARLVKKYPNAKIIYANSAAAQEPISSPYGFSKWAAGEYLMKFHNNCVSCVFPNVYGGGEKSVVDIFKGKETVVIYGDGLQTRDYVHVDDIVSGLVLAKDWAPGEYFMGSGKATTVLDLAEGKTVVFKEARKEARESVLYNSTPNWEPRINVMDYINA